MDALVAAFIALMPFFAMVPLALGAVAIVALLTSPALRAALGAWAQRRLGGGGGAAGETPAELGREVATLRQSVLQLERRLDLAERLLVSGVESPRSGARSRDPAGRDAAGGD